MTPTQLKIIQVYQDLTETKVVPPSFGKVAKKVGCSKSLAHQVITLWKAQNQAFGIKK